jgi:hypothetical protein
MTKRLNAAERAGFRRYAAEIGASEGGSFAKRYQISPAEPALGTLEERLNILIVRHGGRLKVGKPTAAELASVVRYDVLPGPRGGFRDYVEQELTAA